METVAVLGYPIHVESLEGLIEALDSGLSQGRHQHVVTLNPEMLMQGEKNPQFGAILKSADLALPDGAGVVWALRRRGIQVRRVPGIEFSEALIARAAQRGEPVALIGAHPDVNRDVQARLKERYPGLNIGYAHHGFFATPEERAQVAKCCAQANPKYVFIALGVPAQELWIREFRSLFTSPTVFVGVGGSFDVWSGTKQRAHPIFQKLNLEWLYRITSEPSRLKRVYKTLPLFVVKVLLYDNKPVRIDEYGHAERNSPNA